MLPIDLVPSQWTYDTGATGGVGIGFIAGAGGALYFRGPGGEQQIFHFGALGAGLSFGVKLPKLPKPQIRGKGLSGAGSVTQLPSVGRLWKRSWFGQRELTRNDIQGAIVFLEGALGLGVGGSGDVMLFGINSAALAGAAAASRIMPGLLDDALNTATGAVAFVGVNVGLQAGGGIAGLVGYMG